MDPDEKPEKLCASREPVFSLLTLDQFRRALKRNLIKIESDEGSENFNSIFACFHSIDILFR